MKGIALWVTRRWRGSRSPGYLSSSAASSCFARFEARFSTASLGIPARPLLRSVSKPPTSAPTTRKMMMMAFSKGFSFC